MSGPLYLAASMGESFRLSDLIKEQPNEVHKSNAKGSSLLHVAVACNQYECVKVLIEEGNAKTNNSDRDMRTPLHVAASIGSLEIVQLLVKSGASINLKDKDSATPLFLCCECNASSGTDVVEYLVKAGADINLPNASGRTPLIMASKAQNAASVAKLLRLGADTNVKDIYKMSAHDYAEADLKKAFGK